jgi:ATPase subunit of ABC transporter with duplicated ATPase domains
MDRIKEEGLIEKPFEWKNRQFTFPVTEERCGQLVVEVDGVTHGYEGKGTLFRDLSLVVERGERLALMGPNGAGKSTLLRLVRGIEAPQAGVARFGPHNIVPNFFEQNQAEALDAKLTVIETLTKAAPDAQLNEIKGLLGQMMFSGDAMDKPVSVLSGGEKARLALAKFMLTPATMLILDEPTNHLDIPSKEMLESALKQFDGAVLAVSHDRYFLRQVATRVVTIEGGQVIDWQGDYEYMLENDEARALKEEERNAARLEVERANIKAKSKMSKAQKNMMEKEKRKSNK